MRVDRTREDLMLRLLQPRPKPQIEFVCDPKDYGVIAEPLPAKAVMPDWFKRLPAVDPTHVHAKNNGLTIKRCMPFLDALTTGWIVPLAVTVRLEIRDSGATVEAGWDFDRVMVSNHNLHQVAGNPMGERPPCKFHNYWTIKTPPGWSCLFMPPLNRANGVVEVVSGVVDTDAYHSLINFPFFARADDGVYTLERGFPLVQVIPFRRDGTHIQAQVRSETKAESDVRERILRSTEAADGWDRKFARASR
jgi:hypothetical protein